MAADEHESHPGENGLPETEKSSTGTETPGRLLDELMAYIRTRQRLKGAKPPRRLDDEDLMRAVLRHLRRNPVPAGLAAFSLTWLLLASEEKEEDEEVMGPGLGYQLEEEIVQQAKGGFAYTQSRLRELVDRYPWGAAATMVGGGLLAAFLLPERRRQAQASYIESEVGEEPVAGEGFDFDGPEER